MISSVLPQNILNLINRIGVVNKEQIYRMFGSEHNSETIDWCIKKLLANSEIDVDNDTDVFIRRQSVNENDFGQKLLTKATWILASMVENKVRDYYTTEYPSQLVIIDEDDNVYDITVVTPQTVNSIQMTILSNRKRLIPDGIEDNINHIAVLSNEDMAEDVKNLDFDSYCILKDNFNPEYREFK